MTKVYSTLATTKTTWGAFRIVKKSDRGAHIYMHICTDQPKYVAGSNIICNYTLCPNKSAQ